MATLLDWNALSQKISSYMGDSPYCTTVGRTFTYLMLEYLLNLSPEEIEDSITDGPHDRGVDAVYVDEVTGETPSTFFSSSM